MKAKVLSILEVSFVFALMVLAFRFLQSIPLAMEITNSLGGFLFPGYAALLIVSIGLYLFRIRSQPHNLPLQKIKYQLSITAYGFFPILILSVLLNRISWRQWGGAVIISINEIGLLVWFAWMVRNKPARQSIGLSSVLMLFPVISQLSTKLESVAVAIIYFYLFVALSEETLFRGYIQSQLNSVFGHTKHFFGIRWGWGLVISSVLFGLWHLGWSPGVVAWPHVLWTMFGGLFFGLVREKSESVMAPTLLHGIMNYGPQAILFYLFWSK